jgi:hypothetical protein
MGVKAREVQAVRHGEQRRVRMRQMHCGLCLRCPQSRWPSTHDG